MTIEPRPDLETLPALIKAKTVCALAGVSAATLWRMRAAGKLPAPVFGHFYQTRAVLVALNLVPSIATGADACSGPLPPSTEAPPAPARAWAPTRRKRRTSYVEL